MRRFACLLLCSGLALACGGEAVPDATTAAAAAAETQSMDGDGAAARAVDPIESGPHDVAVLDMGELGTIRIELLPELAPQAVARFEELAGRGSYDGTYFHRVIPGFMIQGGDPFTRNADPRDDGKGGMGAYLEDEFSDTPHVRGTVAMANKGFPDSGNSQFFIVHQDSSQLDGRFSIFGRVVEGMETVDAIAALEIDTFGRYGPPDRPYPVSAVVESLRIEPASSAGTAKVARVENAEPAEHAASPASADPTEQAKLAPVADVARAETGEPSEHSASDAAAR
jgi:cyclophilin family peptidyl-prolyl cis-trans isomerase